MTKYRTKAQQLLSSALGPLLQGLRRLEAEEVVLEEKRGMREKASNKLRRLMFSANKFHWYSAAELAIFVLTGGHCVYTHFDKVLFTARPQFMFQECKRFLNGEANAAACVDSVDLADINLVQVAARDNAPVEAPVGSSEDRECDEWDEEEDQEEDPEPVAAEGELQMFRFTTANRDDWLHRGSELVDVDWYSYVTCFQRVPMPKNMQRASTGIRYFPVEQHHFF